MEQPHEFRGAPVRPARGLRRRGARRVRAGARIRRRARLRRRPRKALEARQRELRDVLLLQRAARRARDHVVVVPEHRHAVRGHLRLLRPPTITKGNNTKHQHIQGMELYTLGSASNTGRL